MKVTSHVHDVERIGVVGEKEFTIKTTAKAFDILSSGIYSDPIMAVVRELSCNAYDAHVAAGKKDVPFEIHLPSKLEPWFSVIDHGIGLSDKDATGLFTTYFESNKTDTNDQIGAFGLGSKSPFSYTKAFEVICRYEGKKRTYSIFLNEHGVPSIATLATIDTDECNGVEVKIAVRSGDYSYFEDKVARGLRYFPVKPIVKGRAGFKFQDLPDDAIQGDGYYAWKSKDWRKNFTAVQGNVPYKVDFDHVRDHMSSELRNFLDDYEMVGYFDIGMLDIAASREEVRYDERTVKNLVSMMEKARIDWLKNLDKEITDLTKTGSKWDVYALLRGRFGRRDVKNIAGSFAFSSKLFNEWIEDDGEVVVDAGKYHTIKMYRYGHQRAIPQTFNARQVRKTIGGEEKIIRELIARPDKATQVILNDVTKRSSIRINSWLMSASDKTDAIAIAPKSDRTIENAGGKVPTDKQRKDEYDAIVKRLGNPTIIKLSEETEDVTVTGKKRKNGNTFKKYAPVTGWRRHNDRRKPEFIECEEPSGGIYIEITLLRDTMINEKKHNWNDSTFSDYMERMLSVINYVNGTNYDLKELHGLTTKVIKAVKDDADWSSIIDLYTESVHQIKDIVEVRTRIKNTTDEIGVCHLLDDPRMVEFLDKLDPTSHFRSVVEPAVDAAKAIVAARDKGLGELAIASVTSLNKLVGVEMKVNDKPFFTTADFKDYPMLKHSGISFRDRIEADVIEYIKLIEG